MKFLEIPCFAQLTDELDGITSITGDCTLDARIEAYSCKTAGADKKLYKSLEHQYQVELSKSPGDAELLGTSPFGPLVDASSRKTLIYLISLLNASYPDYDFSTIRSEQFRKENSVNMVINSINTTLAGVIHSYSNHFGPRLWNALESEMKISSECDIYSYIPDLESDPFTEEGTIWSFNYFFFNRKLKRIAFFQCRGLSMISLNASAGLADEHDDDEDNWGYAEDNANDMEF